MRIALSFMTHKKLTAFAFVSLSLLMAAYAPMSITNAQSAAETAKFKELKEKTLKEIERRLEKYKSTMESLEINVKISNAESTIKISTDQAELSAVKDKDGFDGRIKLSETLKDKVQKFMEKVVEQLTGLKDKVLSATSLENLQTLVNKVEDQYLLTQLTDVQGAVTNAIESLTGVVDKIETVFGNLKSQIAKMKDCARGIKSGEGSANASVKDGNVNINASAPGCDDFNWNSADLISKAESQMGNFATMASTIKTILASSIVLLTTLVSSFSGILGGLGSLGSLGNLANLANIGDLGNLLGGGGGLGNLSGLMSSFSAITSQLGIANGMSINALGGLGNLGSLINVGGLGSTLSSLTSLAGLGNQLGGLGGFGF